MEKLYDFELMLRGGHLKGWRLTQAQMDALAEALAGLMDAGAQRELAGDTSLSYSGSTTAPEEYSRSAQTVVVSGGGEEAVVVTREIYPQFRGALVVCQGADDPAVRLAVIEAVSALTGLGSDRVCVIRGGGA